MISLLLMEITWMNKANFEPKKRVFFVRAGTFQPMCYIGLGETWSRLLLVFMIVL